MCAPFEILLRFSGRNRPNHSGEKLFTSERLRFFGARHLHYSNLLTTGGWSRGGFLRSGILKQEREPGSSLRSSGFFSLSCVFVAATLENRSERRKFDSQSPSPRVAVGIWISVRNNLAILQNKYIKEYTKRSARKFLVQCRQIEVHQIDNQFIQPLKTSAKSQILRRVLFCFRHRFLSPSPLLFRRVWEKFGGKYLYRYIQIGQNFH